MKARLLFSTNNQIGSLVIRAATWSRFSHVDIVVGKGRLIGATFKGGVHEYTQLERFRKATRWALFEAPIEMAKVVEQARYRLGKPYDLLGVLGLGLHRDWQQEDKWFCSEFAAKCFLDAGSPLLNSGARVNRITPRDLLLSPLLRFVAGT